MQLFRLLIAIHAFAGTVALIAGAAAYATRKGDLHHRRAGKAFAFGMFGIVITTLMILVTRPSAELLVQAVLSTFLVISGWRAVAERAARARAIDWAHTTVCGVAAATILAWSILTMNVEVIILAAITLYLTTRDLVLFRRGGWYGNRLQRHAAAFGGALLGASVAFAAVLVRRYPSLTWWTLLVPIVVLVPTMLIWRARLAPRQSADFRRVSTNDTGTSLAMRCETSSASQFVSRTQP